MNLYFFCQSATFFNVTAEALPEISQKYEVASVPTVLIFSSGKLVDRVDGANFAEVSSKIKSQVRLHFVHVIHKLLYCKINSSSN